MKDKTLIIIALLGFGALAYIIFRRTGGSTGGGLWGSDKYSQWAMSATSAGNAATQNLMAVAGQVPDNVNKAIDGIAKWGQQGYENARRTDNEEFAQWQAIINSY